jgi:hypothetical protein
MWQIDLDPAMAQSASAAAPLVGHVAAPQPASSPALAPVVAALVSAAQEGERLIAALDARTTHGYSEHRRATADLTERDAANAHALTIRV